MTETEFEFPDVKEDLRPKDPLEAVSRHVFGRYGYDFYFDVDDSNVVQQMSESYYMVKVSVKRPITIKNHKTDEEKRLTLTIKDALNIEVERRGPKDFKVVNSPRFVSVKPLIREIVNKQIDKLYENLFLGLEDLKTKIARPIFIRSQLNPVVNVSKTLFRERMIDPSEYQEKLKIIKLLSKAGYLDKKNGYYITSEEANRLIDKKSKSREFAYYVIGDLILNYQDELDKLRFYTYKPYLKMTTIYYKKAHLYSLNGNQDISEEDILRDLKYALVSDYVKEYNVSVSTYKNVNLTTCVEHLVEDKVIQEDSPDEDLVYGYRNIIKELIKHNPFENIENIQISHPIGGSESAQMSH
ncbi:MAG: hypothetical protein R6U44_00605 [Archaeoglobaceae archaeon]